MSLGKTRGDGGSLLMWMILKAGHNLPAQADWRRRAIARGARPSAKRESLENPVGESRSNPAPAPAGARTRRLERMTTSAERQIMSHTRTGLFHARAVAGSAQTLRKQLFGVVR
ncbi:hypothetical protein MRX96_058010 [Rhipicephalus microplus]